MWVTSPQLFWAASNKICRACYYASKDSHFLRERVFESLRCRKQYFFFCCCGILCDSKFVYLPYADIFFLYCCQIFWHHVAHMIQFISGATRHRDWSEAPPSEIKWLWSRNYILTFSRCLFRRGPKCTLAFNVPKLWLAAIGHWSSKRRNQKSSLRGTKLYSSSSNPTPRFTKSPNKYSQLIKQYSVYCVSTKSV